MAASGSRMRISRIWTLTGMIAVVAATAYLQAQPQPGRPVVTTRSTATQPAPGVPPGSTEGANRKTASTRPAPADEGPSTRPAATPGGGDPRPPREPSASEILRALTKQENAQGRIVRPQTPGRTKRTTVSPDGLPRNAIRSPVRKLLPDGYRIVDRPGRLAREGEIWVFSFESRGQGAPELPIRLLPNRLLEDMEMFSAGGTKPVVFVVSGEVTEYHNVNYLLVQKLLTRPKLGNLK